MFYMAFAKVLLEKSVHLMAMLAKLSQVLIFSHMHCLKLSYYLFLWWYTFCIFSTYSIFYLEKYIYCSVP